MKERPIPLRGHEVRAILAGHQTMMRRVVKPQPTFDFPTLTMQGFGDDEGLWKLSPLDKPVRCPYGVPGDLLWVRETWQQVFRECGGPVEYRADYGEGSYIRGGWRPSIFMPRWASRLTLRITSIRVERVQDITEEDARAEGCCCSDCWPTMPNPPPDHCGCRSKFANIWDSINAERGFGWDVNPWVWVVGFERVQQ